jgi:pseudouridylate synthase
VIGYETDDFPAFLTRSSGHPVSVRMDSVQEVARAIHANSQVDLHSGMVLACPIPVEHAAGPHVEHATIEALKQAKYVCHMMLRGLAGVAVVLLIHVRPSREENICGKATTPFLLSKINELTGGDSLEASMFNHLH